jgi:secreted trypsin-like serine protease
MKRSFFVVAIALATSVVAAPANAVVFGEDIKSASSKYPWMASIWHAGPKDDYYYPICSGSLITQDAVLTAAHCLKLNGTYLIQMGSDTLDGENEDTFYEIAGIWKHPHYDKETFENDVGLLKLASYQTKVKPMAIANLEDIGAVRDTKKFDLFGWGEDEFGDYATFLGHTKLNNQTKEGSLLLRNYDFDPISTIAAGRYIKRLGVYAGSGGGDSGGPLVASIKGIKKVVGITSWGKDNSDLSGPTVFSNVAYYRTGIAGGLATLQLLVTVAAKAI